MGAVAATVQQPCTAVAAAVGECMQLAIAVSADDSLITGDVYRDVITRFFDLVATPYGKPAACKNRSRLARGMRLFNIGLRRKRRDRNHEARRFRQATERSISVTSGSRTPARVTAGSFGTRAKTSNTMGLKNSSGSVS